MDVAAAVIVEGERVLLARRADNGGWEFPGGKREPGESLEAALVREIREELGFEIRVGRPLMRQAGREGMELHFFLCQVAGGRPRAVECVDFRWEKPSRLPGYDLTPLDIEMARRLAHGEVAEWGPA